MEPSCAFDITSTLRYAIRTPHPFFFSVTELAVRIFNIHIEDVALYFK